jgi:hypothetical protein
MKKRETKRENFHAVGLNLYFFTLYHEYSHYWDSNLYT